MPALGNDIAPRLEPIKRDLVLVGEYYPGEPISVALSRKTKISEIMGAKTLTPRSSTPVKSAEEPTEVEPHEPTKHIENTTNPHCRGSQCGLKGSLTSGRRPNSTKSLWLTQSYHLPLQTEMLWLLSRVLQHNEGYCLWQYPSLRISISIIDLLSLSLLSGCGLCRCSLLSGRSFSLGSRLA